MSKPILEPDALTPLLEREYDLTPPITCELIRRGFNDHYRVRSGGESAILRVYLHGKYYIASTADFRFELELLDFLARRGVSVAHPLPRRDGSLLGTTDSETGGRASALFTTAAGKEADPLTPEQARSLGETVGAFHVTANEFHSPHRRYHLDLESLLDRPLREMEALFRQREREGLQLYRPMVAELRRRVCETEVAGDGYGIIHGDLHGRNFHFTEAGGPTLFDFDHGGFGWRAYDLAVCRLCLSEQAWGAFLETYQSVRAISDTELALIPTFARIRRIWDTGDILAMHAVWGDEPDATACDEILEMLEQVSRADG